MYEWVDVGRFDARVHRGAGDECWLWLGPTNGRYGSVRQRRGEHAGAHRVAFVLAGGVIPADQDVCHTCDVPLCCNPAHLFTGTRAQNMADAARKGRANRGEANARARLTESDVREIRASSLPQVALAEKYGVARATVSMVISRKLWAHVKEGPGP